MTFSAEMEITTAKVVLALERVEGCLLDTVVFLMLMIKQIKKKTSRLHSTCRRE